VGGRRRGPPRLSRTRAAREPRASGEWSVWNGAGAWKRFPASPTPHAAAARQHGPVGADRGETLIQAPSFASLTRASEPRSARHRGKAQNRPGAAGRCRPARLVRARPKPGGPRPHPTMSVGARAVGERQHVRVARGGRQSVSSARSSRRTSVTHVVAPSAAAVARHASWSG
jgi:hypothetical protein